MMVVGSNLDCWPEWRKIGMANGYGLQAFMWPILNLSATFIYNSSVSYLTSN